MIWYSKAAIDKKHSRDINSRQLSQIFVLIFLFLCIDPAAAQTTSETLAAAVRLKQAHVIRSYEQCMDLGRSDSQCREELERLHPREIAALSRLAELSTSVPEIELSEAFSSCYSPDRNYEQLIGCWEEAAEKLTEKAEQADNSETALVEEIDLAVLERHILMQLSCSDQPSPLFSFISLERLGKIEASEMVGFDSISCFRINGGIEVNGMRFNSICGYDENEQAQELYPQFLWRGPGTSPGQFISLGTEANFDIVAEWYIESFHGTRLLSQAIRSENTTFGDNTEVKCSDWIRN